MMVGRIYKRLFFIIILSLMQLQKGEASLSDEEGGEEMVFEARPGGNGEAIDWLRRRWAEALEVSPPLKENLLVESETRSFGALERSAPLDDPNR